MRARRTTRITRARQPSARIPRASRGGAEPHMRLVTGLQPVREAIRVHGKNLERVLVEKDGGPQIDAVARFATDRGANVERVTRGDLDRASKGARHQGAIAYAPEFTLTTLAELAERLDDTSVVVALDEI